MQECSEAIVQNTPELCFRSILKTDRRTAYPASDKPCFYSCVSSIPQYRRGLGMSLLCLRKRFGDAVGAVADFFHIAHHVYV